MHINILQQTSLCLFFAQSRRRRRHGRRGRLDGGDDARSKRAAENVRPRRKFSASVADVRRARAKSRSDRLPLVTFFGTKDVPVREVFCLFANIVCSVTRARFTLTPKRSNAQTDEHVQGILNKLAKFPRFRSKVEPVVAGKVSGRLHWVPTEIDFNRHVTSGRRKIERRTRDY